MSVYKDFWSKQSSSLGRHTSEDYYAAKALEHGQIMGSDAKASVIDLGCGAGELLVGYRDAGVNVIAAMDFSARMIQEANRRTADIDIDIRVGNVFDIMPSQKYSAWITASALNQYLGRDELGRLLNIFKNNSSARVFYMFDCIDYLRYRLMTFGIGYEVTQGTSDQSNLYRRSAMLAAELRKRIYLMLDSVHTDRWVRFSDRKMGYGYLPSTLRKLCNEYGLSVEFRSSLFFEYRYHAIITKSSLS